MHLQPYIDDVVSRIDPQQEEKILNAWCDFAWGRNTDGPFVPPARTPRPSKLEWKPIAINDTLQDNDLMVLWQLGRLNALLSGQTRLPLCIRPNYGVGTLTSMLGAKQYIMPREMDSLPNAIAVGEEGVQKILDAQPDLLHTGFGPQVMQTAQSYLDIREKYPEFKEFVLIDHPDMQGPMDNTELLWGSELFYALYDTPDTVHALLQKVTDAISCFMDSWLTLFPNPRGIACFFYHVVRGSMFIRNDSAMNLSPDTFDEFIVPYDAQLLTRYGGGVHFCGRGDHYIASLCKQKGLHGVNLSQPHLNDMEIILENTIDQGIPLTVTRYPAQLAGHDARRLFFTD